MVRIMLVDDHDLVRTGIRRLLDDVPGMEVVADAACGEDALALTRTTNPQVVLMDVNMPGMGGLEATRKLLRIDPAIKVIAVSMHVDGPFPSRMFEAGAAGYLTKGCDVQEMARAIRTVSRGERYVSAEVAQHMVLDQMTEASPAVTRLSSRELQVMVMLGQGTCARDIASTLCLSPKTVTTYRRRLMRKLGVQTDVELTLMALRYGLLDPGSTG